MDKEQQNTVDERVLNALRKIPEKQLHTEIVKPLLMQIGATNIRYLHGSQERGKDFVYISKDIFGDPCLEVCQVKNSPFSGKSSNKDNTITILNQLTQCRKIEVLNPRNNLKERPSKIVLWTTYPIPDKDTADAKLLLEEINCGPFKILGPEKLICLIKEHLPYIYQELAFPGKGLIRSILIYLNTHQEASAFDITRKRNVEDFFVDLGIMNLIDKRNSTRVKSNITTTEYEYLCSLQETLPEPLREFPILKIRENKRHNKVNSVAIESIQLGNYLKQYEHTIKILTSSGELSDKGNALNLLQRNSIFISSLVKYLYAHTAFPRDKATLDIISRTTIDRVLPESFLYIENNLCILGGAGAGKTSLAKMIAQRALEKRIKCLYFPCSNIRKKSTSIYKYISEFISTISDSRKKEIEKYVRGQDIIILDGCDEAAIFDEDLRKQIQMLSFNKKITKKIVIPNNFIPSIPDDISHKIKYNKKEQVLTIAKPMSTIDFERLLAANTEPTIKKDIIDLFHKYKEQNPRIIITSRTDKSLQLLEGFSTVWIMPFDDDQIKDFYKKWFFDDPNSYRRVINYLSKNLYMKEIVRVPMIATLVATLHENGYDLPKSRSEVYIQRFDLLLRKWDQAKGIPSRNLFRSSDKLIFLRQLALKLHYEHKRTFKITDARDIWKQNMFRIYPDNSLDDLIWELSVINNIINALGKKEYSLGHLSYQEFLTAEAIMRGLMQDILVERIFEPWWHNVAIFFAGLCGDVALLVDKVQTRYHLFGHNDLIQEMLEEARFTSPVLRDFLRDMNDDLDFDTGDIGIGYIIRGEYHEAPPDVCPLCGNSWDLMIDGSQCPKCKCKLGTELRISQFSSSCPYCKQGVVNETSLRCTKCGIIFKSDWFEYGLD